MKQQVDPPPIDPPIPPEIGPSGVPRGVAAGLSKTFSCSGQWAAWASGFRSEERGWCGINMAALALAGVLERGRFAIGTPKVDHARLGLY